MVKENGSFLSLEESNFCPFSRVPTQCTVTLLPCLGQVSPLPGCNVLTSNGIISNQFILLLPQTISMNPKHHHYITKVKYYLFFNSYIKIDNIKIFKRTMTFYDPLTPFIQRTKNQIETAISSLESKLQKREKQSQSKTLTDHINDQWSARKPLSHLDYNFSNRPINSFVFSGVDSAEILRQKYRHDIFGKPAVSYQFYEADAAERRRLEEARNIIRDKYLKEMPSRQKITQYEMPPYQSDSMLIQKYENGTKAEEYRKSLQHTTTFRIYKTDEPQQNKPFYNQENVSPYKKFEQERKKEEYEPRSLTTEKKKKKKLKKRSISTKKLAKAQQIPKSAKKMTKSMPKLPENKGKSKEKQIKEKALQLAAFKTEQKCNYCKQRTQNSKKQALKNIESRIRLSSTYTTSKFKIEKKQLQKLEATYEQEKKLRSQLISRVGRDSKVSKKSQMISSK